jgi:galactokinase
MPESVDTFLELIRHKFKAGFFESGTLWIARAPGRLDVMGGIADYSGSMVLQRPIAEATFAAVQPRKQDVVRILSVDAKNAGRDRSFEWQVEPVPYDAARRRFEASRDHWASYIVGVFLVLMHEGVLRFPQGADVLISSEVPEGKGVASSAALEVAVMQALLDAGSYSIVPREIALLCQKAENLVAGAPCGVMDQMTATCGDEKSLLALLCQPAELHSPVPVPAEISFWGLDSGERHAVRGSDYSSVRTATFMGYRIMCAGGDRWDGYLANVSPEEFEREFQAALPAQMSGADFLSRYSGTADPVTHVLPDRVYKVRQSASHPVYEHQRAKRFRELLLSASNEEEWTALGNLMYESHASYSACGLGSHGTDLLANLVRQERDSGLFGARITGGGSGGTVAVVGRVGAGEAIVRVAEKYERATGYRPYVFSGSSDGAAKLGSLTFSVG